MLFSIFIAAMRPYNALLPLILIYLGGMIVHMPYAVVAGALVVTFLIHSAVTLLNDIEDEVIDKTNGRQDGLIDIMSPNSVRHIAHMMILVAMGLGILLLPLSAVAFLGIFIILSWMYNSKPFQVSRRPIGSIVLLGICYAFVPFMLGVSLGSLEVSYLVLCLGASFAIGRVSLSMLKDYKDAHGDALHDKRTFLLVYGRTKVRSVSVIMSVIGYAGILISIAWLLHDASRTWLWTLLGGALAIWLVSCRARLSPKHSYTRLNHQFHQCLQYELLFYGFIVVWVSISLV